MFIGSSKEMPLTWFEFACALQLTSDIFQLLQTTYRNLKSFYHMFAFSSLLYASASLNIHVFPQLFSIWPVVEWAEGGLWHPCLRDICSYYFLYLPLFPAWLHCIQVPPTGPSAAVKKNGLFLFVLTYL